MFGNLVRPLRPPGIDETRVQKLQERVLAKSK